MWRGVVVTHTAHTASPPTRSHLGYIWCNLLINHCWYFRANCCLPLPHLIFMEEKKSMSVVETVKCHFTIMMTRMNTSKTSGWCSPLIPKREAEQLHFLFLLGSGIFSLHFMDVWAVLTLCDCQIPSAVGWDKRGICAGPNMVGRELETACLYYN